MEPGGVVWDDGLAVIVKSGVAPETTIGTARNISKKETPPLRRRKRPDRLSRPPIQRAFIDLGSLLQLEDLQSRQCPLVSGVETLMMQRGGRAIVPNIILLVPDTILSIAFDH